jgi:hypothetical protein
VRFFFEEGAMAIPESQLKTWSGQGSVAQSAATYEIIKKALNDVGAPYHARDFSIFLQGSYGNDTNVYKDSDVDIVICLDPTYYSDTNALSDGAKSAFEKARSPAEYGYKKFKKEVVDWLGVRFGSDVKPGKKAISVKGNGTRRDVDVLVCAKHRRYRKESTGTDSDTLRSELFAAKAGYEQLGEEAKRAFEAYRTQRRDRHLHAFLDTFDLQHARIKGIGPAKQAALASYGIDTAADVDPARVIAVPGFGPINSKPLIEWRQKLEMRFVYREASNDVDRQELARLRASLDSKAASSRRKLAAGSAKLETLTRRAAQVAALSDPALQRAQEVREQASVDLKCLGVPLPPVVPLSPPGLRANTLRGSGASSGPVASANVPACPRCATSMVRRVAKRGRNASGSFWGCSRFPVCKGTRSI